MKRFGFLFLLLFLCFPLLAEEDFCDDFSAEELSTSHILDQRQNYFLTSTDFKIAPKVNPITGEYAEEVVDLVVAGSQPLSSRRFYNANAPYDARYASWRYNPESCFVANFEWGQQELFAAIGDRDGSVVPLKPAPYGTFTFQPSEGFTISGVDGGSHPLNLKVTYGKWFHGKDKSRFVFHGSITDGSGRERLFASPMHRWLRPVHWRVKKGNWLGGSDTLWEIRPNTWTPYQVPVVEERLPNGNILCYTYTRWQEEKQHFPLPQLLNSIVAYNKDKTHILGALQFNYPRTKQGEVCAVEIIGSDGRGAYMQQHVAKGLPTTLAVAYQAGRPTLSYASHQTLLHTISQPDGRFFSTEYDGQRRVTAQYAPVGPNGEREPIARYTYHDRLTVVYDAENQKTHYRYDEHKRLTAVELFEGETLYRTDRFTWEDKTGNLLKKTIEAANGQLMQVTEYQYDANQNPIMERMGDGSSWRTVTRTYSTDGFNLKLSESDRPGKIIRYAYLPGTNLLASTLTYEGETIRSRCFHAYDSCAICIETIVDDGTSSDPNDLRGVTYRKITRITPKQTLPCYGLPEIVEEQTLDPSGHTCSLHRTRYTYTACGKVLQEDHYDANQQYHHSIYNTYDKEERLIATTDPVGNRTEFAYDANHNLIAIIGPVPGQRKELTYDKANRPIRIADQQPDGTLLVIEKHYDKLGRLIEERDVCKNRTLLAYDALGRVTSVYHPDGSIETRAYDCLGNVIEERDTCGYVTKKSYNAYGQVTAISYPDGSSESFVYNPTGTLQEKTDKNGCTIGYTYDLFDHPLAETYRFGTEGLKTKTATYTPFCKLSETDGEGYTTHYHYDFSGRKIAEQLGTKTTHFVYDAFGQLERTQYEGFEQIEKHDLAGRLISKTISGDKTYFEEAYTYDEASRITQRLTSHGAFVTTYNSSGKPIVERNPAGHTTTHSYHFEASYYEVTCDANQVQTILTYDSRGREQGCTKIGPQGETLAKSESLYDNNGNLTRLTHYVYGPTLIETITHRWEYGPLCRLERFVEAEEKETRYCYDEQGRLTTLIKPSGLELHYAYDALGRLVRYFSLDFDYHYTYDRNDRLITVYDAVTKTTTTRAYDTFGNIITETLASQLTLSSTYDSQGRRCALTLPDRSAITYTYHGPFLYQIARNESTCTYTARDREGCLLSAELPDQLGTLTVTRDALSRIATFSAPGYSATFSQEAYDPVGNLLSYAAIDPLGHEAHAYTYDALGQLTSENEHTYRCDSLYNRLEKDDQAYTVNTLCQVLEACETDYTYDADGHLLSDNEWQYTYDTQDRLITLANGKTRIVYTYDPFHRRLSKTVFTKDKRTFYERYLWDGDHEIGTVDEKGKIIQLRVLGEGLGAEIGAAVLFELDGKRYVPIHDHRGNLVVLLDSKTKKPLETYRYTAFGEPLTEATRSPWRFSSKRTEAEHELVFFGRRYYLPSLGRWITQDPQGFDDGPNLYAYLSNSPLIQVDPYGLFGYSGYLSDDLASATQIRNEFFGITTLKAYPKFENRFSNKSRFFDYNCDFNAQFPEAPVGGYLFGNGIRNTFDELGQKALLISTCSGYNTRGVYNATHGAAVDSYEALLNLQHADTTPVYLWHKAMDYYFDHDRTGAPLFIACHSQGAAQLRNALEDYPKERRDRIIIAAFAPLAYIPKGLCKKVTHYVCSTDLVPYLDAKGRRECKDTIVYVKKLPHCKQLSHDFLNPMYLPHLRNEITEYQKLLKDYDR